MSGKMSPNTEKKLKTLDRKFAPLASALLQAGYAVGLNPQISDGYRTPEEQDALYAIGRTKKGKIVTNAKAGQSSHNYGVAIDIFFLLEDGSASWSIPLYRRLWKAAQVVGLQEKGLTWSGDWKTFKEMAHFELSNWKELKNV